MEETAFLAGRLLLGGFFVLSGFNHVMKREQMVGYAQSKGAPSPGFMVPLTGLMLLAGGLSVMAGAYVTVGVALLGLFLLGVSVVMHDFWALEGQEKQSEMTNFLKNMALLGAVLTLLMVQNWPYALNMGL